MRQALMVLHPAPATSIGDLETYLRQTMQLLYMSVYLCLCMFTLIHVYACVYICLSKNGVTRCCPSLMAQQQQEKRHAGSNIDSPAQPSPAQTHPIYTQQRTD